MATYIWPTQLEKTAVIRHFAMKWSSSALVEVFSIRKADEGLLIFLYLYVPFSLYALMRTE